jgi:glycolate oxidase
MALAGDVYRELEDVVGTENISEDPAVIETYSFHGVMGPVSSADMAGRYAVNKTEAVVLPGNTREVQAVIKVCNRRGIKSKVFSTGYGYSSEPGIKGAISLDLRRMNRILEIDKKNMYIVVEPYVSFAQVQAEVMKVGLNTHVIGAGSGCSYLASHSSMGGTNFQSVSHGWSGRNFMASEWVLPTGEILKVGAPGSGAGWFSGDGPGPSLRGIIRGLNGAQGGLGVFTKISGHLHPWPGPPQLEIKGESPEYEIELPENFEYHLIEWPSWEQCAEAIYRIGEAGIAFALHKTGGPGSHGGTVTGSNNDYYAKWNTLKNIPWISYTVVTGGTSPEEHRYQAKVLDSILKDTGGKFLALGELPAWKNRDFANMIKACFIPRTSFRLAGSFSVCLVAQETVDHAALGLSLEKALRDKYNRKGTILNDGTNNIWGVSFEGSHFGMLEGGHLWDPTDENSLKSLPEMAQDGQEIIDSTPLAFSVMGDPASRQFGSRFNNYDQFMIRIKKTFDPHTAFDPMGYITSEDK